MTLHKKTISGYSRIVRSIIPLLIAGMSMTFAGFAQAQVTTYEHCNFDGKKADVPVGNFTWPNLLRDVPNLKDNDISSIKVSNGYKATLYADANYNGKKLVITRDTICLKDFKFNDTMSSIKVERTGPIPSSGSSTGSADYKFEFAHYFKKYKDKALSGYNDKKLSGISVDECMQACATSVEFLCRSIDYDDNRRVCYLSHATGGYATKDVWKKDSSKKYTKNGLVNSTKYDHYENQMGYRRLKKAALPKHNHKKLENKTPEQCRQACNSETSFECRSFDYNFQEKYCHLSWQRGVYPVGYEPKKTWTISHEAYRVAKLGLVASERFDHYIRVRPDYVHVQTPKSVFNELGALPNEGVMADGMRCKTDPWTFQANTSPEDDNTACSDPTGIITAADKRKFNNACRRHDVCYSARGSDRHNCDDQFGHDMYKVCDDKHDDGSPNWSSCRIAATAMTGAVFDWGHSSWKKGQDWAGKNCIKGGDWVRE